MEQDRRGIITVITSPLGFFALSLLIVEGFLSIILIFSKGTQSSSFYLTGMIIGALLFFLVVFGVWILVWKDKGKELTYTAKEYSNFQNKTVKFMKKIENITDKDNIDIIKHYEEQKENVQT